MAWRQAGALLLASVLAGCAPAPAPPPPAPPAPARTGPRSAAPVTPAGVSLAPGWAMAPLGPGLGGPDDLAVAPDGTVYFSDIRAGAVGALPPGGGGPRVVARGLDGPEGIAILPDGELLVAEQGPNRILRLDPASGRRQPWLSLSHPTHLLGLDGIALGPGGLWLPDSPGGRLLLVAVGPDGGAGGWRVVAAGMARPVSAWQDPGGAVFVADENGDVLWAVDPAGGGPPRRLAELPRPDDVVGGPGGDLLVACLDGTVRAVARAGGRVSVVAAGLGAPQGLARLGAGYVVADGTADRIYRLSPT